MTTVTKTSVFVTALNRTVNRGNERLLTNRDHNADMVHSVEQGRKRIRRIALWMPGLPPFQETREVDNAEFVVPK
jgi:hypothetical protein